MSNPYERIIQYVKEELAAYTESHEYEENKLHREIESLTDLVATLQQKLGLVEKKLEIAEKHKDEYREMWMRANDKLEDITERERLQLIKELRSLEHM